MPAKSRRNRRNIPQSRRFQTQNTASQLVAPQMAGLQTNRTATSGSSAKPSTTSISFPYILGELKWIGLVTALVAVILILAYIFLPK